MSVPVLEVVPVGVVIESPDQNRTEFDPVALGELAASVAESGLLQPIKVRRECDLAGERFVLVAGERRLRACRDLLAWSTIPAIVTDEVHGAGAVLGTLAENMVRADPGPLEEARGLAHAVGFGLDPSELASKLGKSPRWVRDRLSLLGLADDVAHLVQSGAFPITRAVLITGLDANRQRLALQAHERGLGIDAFRALVERLTVEQSADGMFDPDDFLRVDEYVIDAQEATTVVPEPTVTVREVPLGIAEVADMLGVARNTPKQWRQRGILPAPDLTISGVPLWWAETIRDWAEKRGMR